MTLEKRRKSRGRAPDGSPNLIDSHVGARIRQRRVLMGMSQEALGLAIGLTFQQVQKYERGANRVGCSRLWDLGRVLDVPVQFFFDELGDAAKAASPRKLAAGAPQPAQSEDFGSELHLKRETLELVRAYHCMPTDRMREAFARLIRVAAFESELAENSRAA